MTGQWTKLLLAAGLAVTTAQVAAGEAEPLPAARWVAVHGDHILSVSTEGRLQSAPVERPAEMVTLVEAPVLSKFAELALVRGPDGPARLLVSSQGVRPEPRRHHLLRVLDPHTGRVELHVEHAGRQGRPIGYCGASGLYVVNSGRTLFTINQAGEVEAIELPRPPETVGLPGDGTVFSYLSWRGNPAPALVVHDLAQRRERHHIEMPVVRWNFLGGDGRDFFFSRPQTLPPLVRHYTLHDGDIQLTAEHVIDVAPAFSNREWFVASHGHYVLHSLPTVGFVKAPERTYLIRIGPGLEAIWSEDGRWTHAGFTSHGDAVMVRLGRRDWEIRRGWLLHPTDIRILRRGLAGTGNGAACPGWPIAAAD